ncbi:hypothetical protein M405DRAFT_818672 [Rhizopogon salebrosus TDB-379]|nr:hypothetical protein M405DRAFT_818672 [Rhizopogon salebrosus TDB-379]
MNEKERTGEPSPPVIATLQTTDDEDSGQRRCSRVSSAQHLPSPHSDPLLLHGAHTRLTRSSSPYPPTSTCHAFK